MVNYRQYQKIHLKKEFNYIDLTSSWGDSAGSGSLYGLYKLFRRVDEKLFLKIPELNKVYEKLSEDDKIDFSFSFGSFEVFSLFMGADVIFHSKDYGGGQIIHEFSIINPKVVNTLERVKYTKKK